MKLGKMISMPNEYSDFGRIRDIESGISYSIPKDKIPEDLDIEDSAAYSVELWENDSGLVHKVEED